jgi:hypothetical protein
VDETSSGPASSLKYQVYTYLVILEVIKLAVIPVGMISWLRWGPAGSRMELIIKLIIVGCYIVWIVITGNWPYLSLYARYLLFLFFLIVAVLSLFSVASLRQYPPNTTFIALNVIITLPFVLLVVWAFKSMTYPKPAVQLQFPLTQGTYYVARGGSNWSLNGHGGGDSPQHYAVDILAINKLGMRANGLYPRDLNAYVIYGKVVYSPCDGEVLRVQDGLPDNIPSETDRLHPPGNHIWLRMDGDVYVLLGHLMNGSVLVKPGDRINRGTRVGKVGNSGNTSEPHLHVHAMRLLHAKSVESEYLLGNGDAIPLLFGGRFLTRNQLYYAK